MEIRIVKTLALLVIQLCTLSNAIDFDEGCFIGEKPILQVAFVMDRTGTFTQNTTDRISFYKQFANLAPTIMEEIDKKYPGSQFALTLFADWEADAKTPTAPGATVHKEPEGCYTPKIKFTTDRKTFPQRMLNTSTVGSGAQENGLSALGFTAADNMLGWIRDATAPNGKPVRRVLILLTDEDDLLKMDNPGSRKEFRGDGTDTCRTSKPPTHEKLREVFEKYQMTVISLLAKTDERPDVEQLYQAHFDKIGGSTRYCGRVFLLFSKKKGVVFTDMTRNFKVPEGFWSEEEAEMNTPKERRIFSEKAIQQLADPPKPKQGDYDELLKFILECLDETDTQLCIFGDPVGFNTLGL